MLRTSGNVLLFCSLLSSESTHSSSRRKSRQSPLDVKRNRNLLLLSKNFRTQRMWHDSGNNSTRWSSLKKRDRKDSDVESDDKVNLGFRCQSYQAPLFAVQIKSLNGLGIAVFEHRRPSNSINCIIEYGHTGTGSRLNHWRSIPPNVFRRVVIFDKPHTFKFIFATNRVDETICYNHWKQGP